MIIIRKKYRPIFLALIVFLIYKCYPSNSTYNNDYDNSEQKLSLTKEKLKKQPPHNADNNDLRPLSNGKSGVFTNNKNPMFYQNSVKKCINYMEYSSVKHYLETDDISDPLTLPFQRPPKNCRTFHSDIIEIVIDELKKRFKDPRLSRIFENAFPNTLDTTILFHVTAEENSKLSKKNHNNPRTAYRNMLPESFIVTGDIHAEWLRDSSWQLSVYQPLIKYDSKLLELIRGAINTQSQLLASNPYCNAFHPLPYMKVSKVPGHIDRVRPSPNWAHVFECKYEIDSLAAFLTLTREYYENAPRVDDMEKKFITKDWLRALSQLMLVLNREKTPTFQKDTGNVNNFNYIFQRDTNIGSETRPLAGTGNPAKYDINLIKSAFRPSDDATIFSFFIPGNAHMAVELKKMAAILEKLKDYIHVNDLDNFINVDKTLEAMMVYALNIETGILEHAVFQDPKHGQVLAYEIDGYGSKLMMDDANIPSLLSLPDLGFLNVSDPLYQNTRKMILSRDGNPYYLKGPYFEGIGGPHIGIHNAWPMSLTMAIRTSNDDAEILKYLDLLLSNTAGLGLIHESIQVHKPNGQQYTRPWFAWANSEFAKTILHLAEHKPDLIFKEEYWGKPFVLKDLDQYRIVD
ncbi:related to DUF1237 domain protein [Saccharomycodes ludwigii]|uniref:Related to DUF1237 domain protein n=1 Tax=Saccharomycodes ludwigii TaxID=36035 RepID=A0A376B6Y1_9ASCO|nr:conserved putative meiotically up-regulated protein [Saccharomycodes ludwigii]KAH3902818.1 conserved putative meiotically up-regulated protein [Saccharomycodes ludwigii]SSD60456.1 related to DUF1237 domain protein [Saccharomycodes ludwigii]